MTDSKKTSIIKAYANLANKSKSEPKLEDLKQLGFTKDIIGHHFGSRANLDKIARANYPNKFFDVSIETLYTPKALKSLRDNVTKYSKFVITTAVNGCDTHDRFHASLKSFCAKNNAALLILVASDPAQSTSGKKWGTISSKLQNDILLLEDTRLNSNVFISTIKLSAKHIDPTTGLARIGQRNGTFIYASPKQRLRPVPVGNGKLPHFMMTTGAITVPNYKSERYMSQRTAYIAEHDHVLGAVVLDIVDDSGYHFSQIQANSDGNFCYFGKKYSADGSVSAVRPEAFVLGDWHAGSTDPDVRQAWLDVSDMVKPKRIILHDAFDGMSINHHEENQLLLKASRSERSQLSLSNELAVLATDLKVLASKCDDVVIVKSNHDEFLEKYLQLGKYITDPQNHRIALDLAKAMLDGKDPLAFGVEMSFKDGDPIWDRIKWLTADDDYCIEGVQCGAHGHRGANGSRGSLKAMEAAYGNSITGHTHTPEILRGAWQVGTSSLLKLEYNKGVSSWLHSSCLLYPGGFRQLVNCIDGKWQAKSKKIKK